MLIFLHGKETLISNQINQEYPGPGPTPETGYDGWRYPLDKRTQAVEALFLSIIPDMQICGNSDKHITNHYNKSKQNTRTYSNEIFLSPTYAYCVAYLVVCTHKAIKQLNSLPCCYRGYFQLCVYVCLNFPLTNCNSLLVPSLNS